MENAPSGKPAPAVAASTLTKLAYERHATAGDIALAEHAQRALRTEDRWVQDAVAYAESPPSRRGAPGLASLRPRMIVAALLGIAIIAGGAVLLSSRARPRVSEITLSSNCAPLPTGWQCRKRSDGTIIDAKPTPSWNRDATALPQAWTYVLGQGTAVIIAAYPPKR